MYTRSLKNTRKNKVPGPKPLQDATLYRIFLFKKGLSSCGANIKTKKTVPPDYQNKAHSFSLRPTDQPKIFEFDFGKCTFYSETDFSGNALI